MSSRFRPTAPVLSLLYGFHSAHVLLERAPTRCRRVLLAIERRDARAEALLAAAAAAGVPVERLADKELDRLAADGVHQGVLLEYEPAPEPDESELYDQLEARRDRPTGAGPPLLLVLDEVTDPRNFGALLRVADGAGVDAVITTRRNSPPLTPVVHKASAGAAAVIPLYRVTNLARALTTLRELGVDIIGLDDRADADWHAVDLCGPQAIVLGAEGIGMRRLTREHCDRLVRLPMAGVASSLNVSVAAGIALYEVRRQRDAVSGVSTSLANTVSRSS